MGDASNVSHVIGLLSEFSKLWSYRPAVIDILCPNLKTMTVRELLIDFPGIDGAVTVGSKKQQEEITMWMISMRKLIAQIKEVLHNKTPDEMCVDEIVSLTGKLTGSLGVLGFYFGSAAYRRGRESYKEIAPIIEAS